MLERGGESRDDARSRPRAVARQSGGHTRRRLRRRGASHPAGGPVRACPRRQRRGRDARQCERRATAHGFVFGGDARAGAVRAAVEGRAVPGRLQHRSSRRVRDPAARSRSLAAVLGFRSGGGLRVGARAAIAAPRRDDRCAEPRIPRGDPGERGRHPGRASLCGPRHDQRSATARRHGLATGERAARARADEPRHHRAGQGGCLRAGRRRHVRGVRPPAELRRSHNLHLTDVARAAIDGTLDPKAWAAPRSTHS